LHGFSEVDGHFAKDGVGFLFRKHGETSEKWQTSIDERGQLPGKDHQGLAFDRLALEDGDGDSTAFGGGFCGGGSLGGFGSFASFAFFSDGFWKISGLAELTDGFVLRSGLDHTSRFLAPGVKGNIGVSGHRES
jgi:hypothetical protein